MGLTRGDFPEELAAHREPTLRFLRRLTRNAADAEDLLQESLLAVWRKRDQYSGNGSLGAYLRRTAFRLYLNQREKTKRRERLGPPPARVAASVAPNPEAEAARRDAVAYLMERVNDELETLPDELRDAFVLFRFEGLRVADIADAMDAPVKTIETRLRRATLALAARLRRYRHLLPEE